MDTSLSRTISTYKFKTKRRNFVPICFTIEARASQYSDKGSQCRFMLTNFLHDACEGLEIAPGHVRYCQAIIAVISTSDAASPLAMPEHELWLLEDNLALSLKA